MPPLKKFATTGGVSRSLSRRLPFTSGNTQRLWLCRHGQTAGNEHHLVQGGGLDLPLNELGNRQGDRLGKAVSAAPSAWSRQRVRARVSLAPAVARPSALPGVALPAGRCLPAAAAAARLI